MASEYVNSAVGLAAEEPVAEGLADSPQAPSRWQRLQRNPTAMVAVGSLLLLVVCALAAPLLTAGTSPLTIAPAQRLLGPRLGHLFGTDHLGRDVFGLVVYGSRTSLLVGALVTLLSLAIAVVVGLLAGFYHRVDTILMRVVDGLMAFPGIVLATAAAGYLGPGVTTVIVALSIVLIAPTLRVVRGSALVVRQLPMIEAAQAVGVPELRILTKYVFPAVVSPLLVQASFVFSAAVLGEAALSFIGLGVGAKDVSWGSALTEARDYIQNGWWIAVFPGAALVLTILSLNLLGDTLRDLLDPRLARS